MFPLSLVIITQNCRTLRFLQLCFPHIKFVLQRQTCERVSVSLFFTLSFFPFYVLYRTATFFFSSLNMAAVSLVFITLGLYCTTESEANRKQPQKSTRKGSSTCKNRDKKKPNMHVRQRAAKFQNCTKFLMLQNRVE